LNLPRNFNQIFIPARSLTYGMYQFTLTITIHLRKNFSTSNSANIKIIPSSLVSMNLIQPETSMITIGFQQDLLIEPGKYSIGYDPGR
jgi:hypothetical protein